MSPLTTHILDTATGKPARGVPIILERETAPGTWEKQAEGVTNDDGRCPGLLAEGALERAVYRLTFDIATYEAGGAQGFYPYAQIVFRVSDPAQHHHVPLLLSPFGYSTYRGS